MDSFTCLVIPVWFNGQRVEVLMDTGCGQTSMMSRRAAISRGVASEVHTWRCEGSPHASSMAARGRAPFLMHCRGDIQAGLSGVIWKGLSYSSSAAIFAIREAC